MLCKWGAILETYLDHQIISGQHEEDEGINERNLVKVCCMQKNIPRNCLELCEQESTARSNLNCINHLQTITDCQEANERR